MVTTLRSARAAPELVPVVLQALALLALALQLGERSEPELELALALAWLLELELARVPALAPAQGPLLELAVVQLAQGLAPHLQLQPAQRWVLTLAQGLAAASPALVLPPAPAELVD